MSNEVKNAPMDHIAFIMDGNGRWAKKRLMPREYGHKVGAQTFQKITEYCGDIGIHAVTVYAFSTENWKRPKNEVEAIFKLFDEYLTKAVRTMMQKDIRIIFLGDKSVFTPALRQRMLDIEEDSRGNSRILNIAINYGGRDEICMAVNRCIEEGITDIKPDDISKRLYTVESGEPDLIVRTGGEFRLSNFLMWQGAYSELYFTDKLWPDLTTDDVDEAVRVFQSRNRRYGGV